MQEFKGTKGEWSAKDNLIGTTDKPNCVGLVYIKEHQRGVIDTEMLANAKLIAAAPELLEALQFCVDRLNWNDSKSHEAYAMANAAINRALHP